MIDDLKNGGRLGAAYAHMAGIHVMKSSAVTHPYLRALSEGDFPNVHLALQDFAFQYGLYSRQFTRYMLAVVSHLSSDEHKTILLANLAEEQGDTHDVDLPPDVLASVDGQPHALLFQRFQTALGVDPEAQEATPDCPGQVWSQQFLTLCEMNEYVGVGAIGIGTEFIVAKIYQQILKGITTHSKLTPMQHVFFDLHSDCDEEHAAQMLLITEDLAVDEQACEQIEHGIRSAVEMRSAFWDAMLARALQFPTTDRTATVGH